MLEFCCRALYLAIFISSLMLSRGKKYQPMVRVATVREKYLENEIFSRSGKSQGILWMVREIKKGLGKSGKSQGI